jgi:hypothetical protein
VPFRLGFLGSAVLLLYPPQLLFLGQSGYTVTLIGAAGLVALYVARLNARRARVAVSNG